MALPKNFCLEQDNTPPLRVSYTRRVVNAGTDGAKLFGTQFAAMTLIGAGVGLMSYESDEFKAQVLAYITEQLKRKP